ncbi:hypothetical protein D3C86_1770820 [compost metagenome]
MGDDLVLDGLGHHGRDADDEVDPGALEELCVARVVDARQGAFDPVQVLGHLAEDVVVLVAARDRHHHVGPRDLGALQQLGVGGVAREDDDFFEFLDDHRADPLVALDQSHLVPLAEEGADQVQANLAAACDENEHGVMLPCPSRGSSRGRWSPR